MSGRCCVKRLGPGDRWAATGDSARASTRRCWDALFALLCGGLAGPGDLRCGVDRTGWAPTVALTAYLGPASPAAGCECSAPASKWQDFCS